MTSDPHASLRAIATIGAVTADLVKLTERLPVEAAADAEAAAALLERLGGELGDAAVLIRAGAVKPDVVIHAEPGYIR